MIKIVSPEVDCFARGKRGVGFLLFSGNDFVNAHKSYSDLKSTDRSRLWTSFDYWITQIAIDVRERCHGYNKTQYGGRYTSCFQFEVRESRFYGFLSNPDDLYPKFLFFTAIHHLNKYRARTEETVLAKVTELSKNKEIERAIFSYVKTKRAEGKNER
jgi:hypothetical protein